MVEEKKQRWEVMRQWLNNQTQEMTAAYGASGVSAVMTAFYNDKNTAQSAFIRDGGKKKKRKRITFPFGNNLTDSCLGRHVFPHFG